MNDAGLSPAPSGAAALRVLHVASEVYPIVKTGGLGDVVAALPPALARAGADVRLLIPGYPEIVGQLRNATLVALLGPCFGAASIMVRVGRVDGIDVPVYVVDAPALFDRPGNPYLDGYGQDWPDNALRFGALSWIGAHLAIGDIDRGWRPDIVHAHDWHAGLTPVYMHLHPQQRARSVFTVHNLAFNGSFDRARMIELMLPAHLFNFQALEFHGQGAAIKGALQFADRIATVSPTYAREIQTAAFGCGLEGVISARRDALSGILNGIDPQVWNPAADPMLTAAFSIEDTRGKAVIKAALQQELGLQVDATAPVVAVVSRLTAQKGIDLLIEAMPALLEDGVQLALLGSGDPAIEQALRTMAVAQPGRIGVQFGYNEALAHRVIAGADIIAVPSRFEPCGLTQLYGLRYGTLPLVRRVGGLADTVVDADGHALAEDRATGFVFHEATAAGLLGAARRALALYRQPPRWSEIMRHAMRQDFSWESSAQAYLALYNDALRVGVAIKS